MQKKWLFTDGSVNTKTKVGYGAMLFCDNLNLPEEILKKNINTKQFEETSSSKLEIQTLIWALEQIEKPLDSLIVYTDSQNIVSLPNRREKLESSKFKNKKGESLNHALLYQQFYKLMDSFPIEIIKIKGHKKSSEKSVLDKIFTLVDRASRQVLRDVGE